MSIFDYLRDTAIAQGGDYQGPPAANGPAIADPYWQDMMAQYGQGPADASGPPPGQDPNDWLQQLLINRLWQDPYRSAMSDKYIAAASQPEPTFAPPATGGLAGLGKTTTAEKWQAGLSALADAISAYGHAKSLGTSPLGDQLRSTLERLTARHYADQYEKYGKELATYKANQRGALLHLGQTQAEQSAADKELQAATGAAGRVSAAKVRTAADVAKADAATRLGLFKQANAVGLYGLEGLSNAEIQDKIGAEQARRKTLSETHQAAQDVRATAAAARAEKTSRAQQGGTEADRVQVRQIAKEQRDAVNELKSRVNSFRDAAQLTPLGFGRATLDKDGRPVLDPATGKPQFESWRLSEMRDAMHRRAVAAGLDENAVQDVMRYFEATLGDYWRQNKPKP